MLGKNRVGVPSHLYKVVLAETAEKSLVSAFVVPNKRLPLGTPLREYRVRPLPSAPYPCARTLGPAPSRCHWKSWSESWASASSPTSLKAAMPTSATAIWVLLPAL